MKSIPTANGNRTELPHFQLEQESLDFGHGAAAGHLAKAAALFGGRASREFSCKLGKPSRLFRQKLNRVLRLGAWGGDGLCVVRVRAEENVTRFDQVRAAKPIAMSLIIAPAGLFIRMWRFHFPLHKGADTDFLRLPLDRQAACPLQKQLAHDKRLGSFSARGLEAVRGVVLRLARNFALRDDSAVDLNLHHTAPRPRLRLRRTIW